jgi:hypothetical protein
MTFGTMEPVVGGDRGVSARDVVAAGAGVGPLGAGSARLMIFGTIEPVVGETVAGEAVAGEAVVGAAAAV